MLLICATIRRYMNGSCFREHMLTSQIETFQGIAFQVTPTCVGHGRCVGLRHRKLMCPGTLV